MTENQKKKADNEMNRCWQRFVYEKAIADEVFKYRHLDEIIRSGMFVKKYVQCDNNIKSFWIFILCDGEFGFFDGVEYRKYIPVSLAELVGVDKTIDSIQIPEVQIVNGCYEIVR